MARDIEEFLRRAAERRQQQKGGAPGPAQPQPPQQQPPRQQPPRPSPQPPIIEVEAEIVEPAPRRPIESRLKPPRQSQKKKPSIRTQSVSDHVKSHINTSDISDHATQLGDRISSVSGQVDSRVHSHLDHDLTALDDDPSVTDSPPTAIFGGSNSNAAEQIRQLLSNPRSVGQAILVAEILKRPNFD